MTTPAAANQKTIPLESLGSEQLIALKQKIEEEIDAFQEQAVSLKRILTQQQQSLYALEAMKPENDEKPILIPLAPGVYVKGKTTNITSLMCDIGTGYYVEKNVAETEQFMTRKASLLQENLKQVQSAVALKTKNAEQIENVLRQRGL